MLVQSPGKFLSVPGKKAPGKNKFPEKDPPEKKISMKEGPEKYPDTSKIRKVTFNFQNFEKQFQRTCEFVSRTLLPHQFYLCKVQIYIFLSSIS